MPNVIPPLLSDSPPPMVTVLDDEEDDFGDFTSAGDASYNYDNYSLPSTPQHVAVTNHNALDINSNTNKLEHHTNSPDIPELFIMHSGKNMQKEWKNCDLESISATEVNLLQHQSFINNVQCRIDSNCCNQDQNTDQELPIESVPTNATLEKDCLNDIAAACTKKDDSAIKMHNHYYKNKEKNVENVSDIDINVPSTTDKLSSVNIASDGYNENNTNCNSVLQVPVSPSKSSKDDIRENSEVVMDTKDAHIDNDEFENQATTDVNSFFYIEEPPDLNVVDDKISENEDFIYYNNFESDLENEVTYSKLENEKDVNENRVSSKSEENQPANNSLDSTYNEFKTEEIISEGICGSCCNSNKMEIDFVEDTHLTDRLPEKFEENHEITGDVKSNNHFSLLYDKIESISRYSVTPTDDELNVIQQAAQTSNEVSNFPCSGIQKGMENEENFNKIFENNVEPIDNTDIRNINEESNSKLFETPTTTCFDKITEENPAAVNEPSSLNEKDYTCSKEETKFGDFADFSHSFPEADIPEHQVSTSNKISTLSEQLKESELEDFGDEELGNYGEFAQAAVTCLSTSTDGVCVHINKTNALELAEKILFKVFPPCVTHCENYTVMEYLGNDQLFNQMKDITEANALSYQWAKSASQEKMLKALNIDTRNILYGPGWNPLMPKFAANLRTTPLEPVKSEMLTPTLACTSNPNPSFIQSGSALTDVPSAQFDWKGAGLVNPLDSAQSSTMLLDLEQLVASLDLCHVTDSMEQSSNDNELGEWDYWLKSLPPDPKEKSHDSVMQTEHTEKKLDFLSHRRNHSDNESVKSLQLTTDVDKSDANTANFIEDFDDSGYQPPPALWQKNVLLKETHISSELFKSKRSDTINVPTSTVLAPKNVQILEQEGAEDTEFTDFQMSLPLKGINNEFGSNTEKVNVDSEMLVSDILQPIPAKETLKPCLVPKMLSSQPEILWPDPGVTSDELLHIELSYSRNTSYSNLEKSKCDEETQLESKINVEEINKQYKVPSLENTMCNRTINKHLEYKSSAIDLQSELNLYKVIKKDVDISSSTKSQQPIHLNSLCVINEDNAKINAEDAKPQINKATNILHPCVIGKENVFTGYKIKTDKLISADVDDEWSDFICNPEPLKYPLKSVPATNIPERTSTPELQLSIPHLSQLQPPKQPIPVITPHGLIQTKIPSNTSNLNVCQPSPHSAMLRNIGQPSIISQQYQDHLNGPIFPKLIQSGIKIQENLQSSLNLQPYESFGKKNTNDDDDWTEFVSNTPVQQTKMQQKVHKQNHNNWSSNVMPNIITNPAHLELCNYMSQKPQNSGTVLSFVKSTVPSISALPELDFAAPKNKSFKKK